MNCKSREGCLFLISSENPLYNSSTLNDCRIATIEDDDSIIDIPFLNKDIQDLLNMNETTQVTLGMLKLCDFLNLLYLLKGKSFGDIDIPEQISLEMQKFWPCYMVPDSIDYKKRCDGTTKNAAEKGHLDCLKYAHENGCDWDEQTCANAAKNGQ
jgi:hypothetical protein